MLARGVNKAFREVSQLVPAVLGLNLSNPCDNEALLKEYEVTVSKIYENERSWAEFKAFWLETARLGLRYFLKPIKFFFKPLIAFYSFLKSCFIKEPTLGELLDLFRN